LFGSARDEDTEMYEDRDGRIRVFVGTFQAQVQKGLEAARKEGGELGRYAAMAQKVLEEGFEGYEVD
jgi:pre-rRNA-processing protein IPI1